MRDRMLSWALPSLAAALAAAPLLLLAACGGGGGGGPTDLGPPASGTTTVSVVDFTYSPKSLRVAPGTTVRWVMQGSDTTHTVTALDGSFDSGQAFRSGGDSFQHTFTSADNGKTFEYSCVSHKDCCQMQGSILVGDDAPSPAPGY